jgi:dihydroorotate dehydrogenase (fumarate)
MNLTTTYLGLKLRTPLVPSASPLSESLDNLKRMEDVGAAAVVLHSLFEEQIRRKPAHLARGFALDPEAYLDLIVKAKESLDIPVIASLNGNTFGGWTTFSRQITTAGADALELNFYATPTDAELSGEEIERDLLTIVAAVKAQVPIPVAIKLSPFYTNLSHFAQRLEQHGADGLVLFNRFFQPDIDLRSFAVVPRAELSTSAELRLPLRWIAILHRRLTLNLAASGGVHHGADALKLIMAGADVTMLCSVLLRHGIDYLSTVECEMEEWLEQQECESLEQVKGRFTHAKSYDAATFERAQYLRAVGAMHS